MELEKNSEGLVMKPMFGVKVAYTNEEGKRVKSEYMLTGASYGDVEAQAHSLLEFPIVIKGINMVKYNKIIPSNAVGVYKCKVVEKMLVDQEDGKIKNLTLYLYVNADSTQDAEKIVHQDYEDTNIDYELKSIVSTNYAQIFMEPLKLLSESEALNAMPDQDYDDQDYTEEEI